MERRMTHNEYSDYCREAAKRLWDKEYSIEEFKKEIKDIEITPYDLSEYPKLSDGTKEAVEALFEEECTDKNGKRTFKGFSRTENIWKVRERLGIVVKEGNYISGYGVNSKEYLIFSWCEGDIYLHIYNSEKEFLKEDAACKAFYENN